MSEESGAAFVVLQDDAGEEHTLEFIDMLEYKGTEYHFFFPAEEEGNPVDEDELGLIILKMIEENGEELLSTLDSDEEIEEVANYFYDTLFDAEEDEDEEA